MMRAVLLSILLAVPALAEDAPCKAQGDLVVCQRKGFDTLVAKTVSFRAEAEKAAARLVALEAQRAADLAAVDVALAQREAAVAELAACKARPFPRRKMFTAAGLGVLAGLATAAAPQVSSDVVASGLLVVGVAGALGATVLILSE